MADLRTLRLLLTDLAHRIRTPLSVVSNDLHYFGTIVGKEEVSRTLRRTEQIGGYLEELTSILHGLDEENYVAAKKEILAKNSTADERDGPLVKVIRAVEDMLQSEPTIEELANGGMVITFPVARRNDLKKEAASLWESGLFGSNPRVPLVDLILASYEAKVQCLLTPSAALKIVLK